MNAINCRRYLYRFCIFMARERKENMFYLAYYDAPVGRLLLAEQNGALAGLWIEGQKYFARSLKDEETEEKDTAVLKQTKAWLDRYFKGEKPQVSELPLAPVGSEFQKVVWKLLCEIPYGEVTTYGAIAKKVAALRGIDHMSAQATGGAVGRNPISIIIPCHRLVGANGSLTGYAGGIEKKIWLLRHEGIDTSKLKALGK